MNEHSFVPIGMPRGLMDARSFQIMFPNAPPEAFEAMQRAHRNRAAQQYQPPLRRHVKAGKPDPPKGSEPAMPAAVATPQAKATPPAPVATPRPARRATISTRQAAAAKSCHTEEDRKRLYDVGMEIRARVGLFLRRRDIMAEQHCERVVGFDVRATATEGSPTGGGFLTPTPLSDSVIELRAQVGLSRRVGTVIPMSSDTLTVPKVTGELTAYYPGEGQAPTASDLTLGALGFVAKKRAVIAHASGELNGDALISFADTIRRGAAFALAAKEDRELILGDGTSTYGNEVGLLSSIGSAGVAQAATGHDLLTELDIADWTAPMAKLPERHVDARLSWIMSAAVYFGSALRACGGNSQGFDELGRPMLLGYPVNFSIDMPTATAANTVFALFGNFEKCVMIGERTPFALAMSEHAGFASGTLAFRAGSRYDLNVSEAGDSSNPGAYVALKTAS